MFYPDVYQGISPVDSSSPSYVPTERGSFAGAPLDADQTHAVVAALKQVKETSSTEELSIGIKAKLAGGIVGLLGNVPQGRSGAGTYCPQSTSCAFEPGR